MLPEATMTIPPVETLLIGSLRVPLIWRTSPRARRLSARFDPKKRALIVTCPPQHSRQTALSFLHTQERWILKRFEKLTNQTVHFANGCTIPIAGSSYVIQHQPHARGGVWIDGTTLHVSGQDEFVARRITDFLKNHARTLLTQELRSAAQAANLYPTKLDIRDTASRWGSCNSAGRIMLSWRLVMAPTPVRHYLIAHELAHLKHMNHSPAFWAYTDSLTPYRQQAEAWLKQYGAALLGAQ